jgi:hypothetical protein
VREEAPSSQAPLMLNVSPPTIHSFRFLHLNKAPWSVSHDLSKKKKEKSASGKTGTRHHRLASENDNSYKPLYKYKTLKYTKINNKKKQVKKHRRQPQTKEKG